MWMIRTLFSKSIKYIVALFFPTSCYICHNSQQENISICVTCLSRCKKAVDTPSPFISSLYSYKDPSIKKIIHAIKYFHRKDLILPFAQQMSKELQKIEAISSYTIIPIPMPTLRKYIRGYNHSTVLAQEISTILKIPTTSKILLRNPTNTKVRQVETHTRNERFKNQHNTFIVTTNVSGMNLLLIDDVATTGATLSAARKILLEHGAASVQAFTIAH